MRGLADWRTELPAEAHAAAVRRAGEQDEAVVAERAAQAEERALRIVSALEALHARFDRSDASPPSGRAGSAPASTTCCPPTRDPRAR